jgi:DNA-binding NtrC family response regulator
VVARLKSPGVPGELDDIGRRLAQAHLLVVDDEPGMRNFIGRTLGPRCKRLDLAADTAEATARLDAAHYDAIVLDNVMSGRRGIDWLAEQRSLRMLPPVVLITAFADLDTAIQAIQAGASDFVLKPFRSNQLMTAVARSLERAQLERENLVLRHELRANADHILLRDRLIGGSAAIARIRETIARVAPLPSSVLLTGQSGTGKEVAARMVHDLSERASKPFVPVNCAAIPHDMVETELFGHLKGAFTGAATAREGLFTSARGGTLFLDEIGDLPLPVQGKLLRVLEDRRVRPLGAEREVAVDVRLIFATNADLEAAVAAGRFRADLYYRMNIVQIHMPPLRDRGNDVQDLADLFMDKLSRQLGMPRVEITPEDRAALAGYAWPGNVRELRNMIERALILGRMPVDALRPQGAGPEVQTGHETLAEAERRTILAAIAGAAGDRDLAADRLGISRKTIDRRCRDWNV